MISSRPSGSVDSRLRDWSAYRWIERSPIRHRQGWELCSDGARTAISRAAWICAALGKCFLHDRSPPRTSCHLSGPPLNPMVGRTTITSQGRTTPHPGHDAPEYFLLTGPSRSEEPTVTIGNAGSNDSDRTFGEADPADVAEQQRSVDPDAADDVIDEERCRHRRRGRTGRRAGTAAAGRRRGGLPPRLTPEIEDPGRDLWH